MSQEAPLRDRTRALEPRLQKILTALVARMIDQSDRVRDRDWISEQFVQSVLVAMDDEDDLDPASAPGSVERVQAYASEHAPTVLPLAFDVFGAVAQTLQARGGPITAQAAMDEVMTYVES